MQQRTDNGISQKRVIPILPRLLNIYRALRSIDGAFISMEDAEAWDEAESCLRSILQDANVEFEENGKIKE